MLDITTTEQLARHLLKARRSNHKLTHIDAQLLPATEEEANRVQDLVAEALGPIGGYKVACKKDGSGSYGIIPASHVFSAPPTTRIPAAGLKSEAEIAFTLGQDLTLTAGKTDFSREDVAQVIAGAFIAVEILDSRLAFADPVPSLLAQADHLSNWGLVHGELCSDWQAFAEPRTYDVLYKLGNTKAVDGAFAHPSGLDPFAPVVWLAQKLATQGRTLKAGQKITTGAFGGSHMTRLGDRVEITISDLPRLRFVVSEISTKALPN